MAYLFGAYGLRVVISQLTWLVMIEDPDCMDRESGLSIWSSHMKLDDGWWFQPPPLKNMDFISWDDEIPNLMGK